MVRSGIDVYMLPGGAGVDAAQEAIRWFRGHDHSTYEVHREMYLQILMDYSCLPDPATMTLNDLVFFYEGRRAALRKATKPKS